MRSSKLRKTIQSKLLMGMILLAPAFAWSQSTSSLLIPLNNQTIQISGKSAQVDLLKEIKKLKPALASSSNIEIQMVRIQAKSNIGGGQVFLKINNDLVASAVIETNAEVFSSADPRTFERFELKNIDRARISVASIVIQNISLIKLNQLEVIFGAVQEPIVFGNYANQQAMQVGGALLNDNRDMRPSQQAVQDIYSKYYGDEDVAIAPVSVVPVVTPAQNRPQPVVRPPVVVAPKPAKPQVAKPPQKPASQQPSGRCVQDYRGARYCIGDIVENTWGFAQKIVGVNPGKNEVTLTSEMYDEPYTRHVDMLKR